MCTLAICSNKQCLSSHTKACKGPPYVGLVNVRQGYDRKAEQKHIVCTEALLVKGRRRLRQPSELSEPNTVMTRRTTLTMRSFM